jgi:hypothetical protein
MNRTSQRTHLTPGRLLYLCYHLPLALVQKSRREGGPLKQWQVSRGRAAMERAAWALPPIRNGATEDLEVCFLTGRRFWFQTAFCYWSLATAAGRPFRLVLVDDGTLDARIMDHARQLFPNVRVELQSQIENRLNAVLPADRFPTLRRHRLQYVHLRKLTDVHAGKTGWRVVLDSDMLFFHPPRELLAWLHNPSRPVHMMDVKNAYGYPIDLLNQLAGSSVPERLNVGVLGLNSAAIDWERLEAWCSELLTKHGSTYYLEQALSALLLAGSNSEFLDPQKYVVMPDEAHCVSPAAVLHHYVAESKRGYYLHGWKAALALAAPGNSKDH